MVTFLALFCKGVVLSLTISTTGFANDEVAAVELDYNWPAGLSGTMQIAINRTTIQNSNKQVLTMKGSSRLSTTDHPDGLLVSLSDVEYSLSDSDQSRGEFMRTLMAEMASLDMSMVISTEGELIDVTNFEESATEIRKRVKALFDDLEEQAQVAPAVIETVTNMLDTALSDEQVAHSATANWNRDVQQWHGMQLSPGSQHRVEFKTQSPLFPDQTLDSIGTYTIVGKVSCKKDDAENLCVELNYQSELTSQSKILFRDFLHNMLVEMSQGEMEIDKKLIDVKLDSSVDIITEPDTLIPHSIDELQSVYIDMGPQYGKQRTINQTSIQYSFD